MAMRNFQMKRQRGRNRGGNQGGGGKPQQNANRAFDSTGPDNIKVRGHAQHVYEKYQSLARDAASAGDRVLAENYLQHAEHYFRTIRALQPNKPVTEIVGRETFSSGFDIDFEDETVAAAIEATDAAALEREQNGGAAATAQPTEGEGAEGGQPQGGQGGQNQGAQNRPWEQRPPRGERYQNDRYQGDRNDRYQGERSQGGDRYQGDRPRDQQGGGDRPRYEREDRQQGERPQNERYQADRQQGDRQQGDRYPNDRGQGERQQGGDRPRYENRDRPYNRDDRDRTGGDRPRYENRDRDDRGQQGDRPQGDRPRYERDRGERSERPDRAEPAADISSPLVAPALEGAPAPSSSRVLRSEDGGVSHAPAFLSAGAATAPFAAAESDEAPKPRRRRKPRSEGAPEAADD